MKTGSETVKYPIGIFQPTRHPTGELVQQWIQELDEFPKKIESVVRPLDDNQLNTPYRDGAWSVRQLVHHIADSHHNSYIRFKWALTEDTPVIKAYDEKAWASLPDAMLGPIAPSIAHLKAVHQKLVYLLRVLPGDALNRSFVHPADGVAVPLTQNIEHYAWHGAHHLAQIQQLIRQEGW